MTQVGDAVTSNDYGTADLKSQSGNNYGYDLIGNMVSDVQGGISNITWTIYGKIKKITKSDGSTLEYKYDADGNRVSKVYTHAGQVDKTWYVRDASGNVLAIYGNKDGDGNVYWKEQQLYGSSRLGSWYPELNIAAGAGGVRELWGSTNKKQYELSNHLGNVLATVTDELKSDNTALVMSASDYYPFGMIQPDRSYSSGGYRYGFNGKENDNEVKGDGNQQDYGMRIYDPRVGRFLSVDPLTLEYPELTSYQFASNRPIDAIDLDGAESSYKDPTTGMMTVPSDAIRHPIPPGVYMPSNGAAEGGYKRNWALETAAPFVAAGAIVADASAGFPVTRTTMQVATAATVANLYSYMEISGNAKNPAVKKEFEEKAKENATDLLVMWGTGKLLQAAGSLLTEAGMFKPGPLVKVKGSCFVAGTLIWTKDGLRPIEKLNLGDSVWAFNENIGQPRLQRIECLLVSKTYCLSKLQLGNEVIWATPDHPFRINSYWVPLKDISAGDSLLLFDGKKVVIDSLTSLDSSTIVYNFTVSGDHSYYISSAGILVHNDCYLPTTKVSAIKLLHPESTILKSEGYKSIRALSDEELIKSVTKPADGRYIQLNSSTGRAFDGNTRIYELQRRGLNDVVVPYKPYQTDNSMFYDM